MDTTLERSDIANLEAEDFEKLKKQVAESEDGEEIIVNDDGEETPDPDKKEEETTTPAEKKTETPDPDKKEEETTPPAEKKNEEENNDDKLNDPNQAIDQYLSDVKLKQDLSKYSVEELQKIIHVQNKRLYDKDGFINVLQQEKRQERSKLREEINNLQKDYEEKKKNRLTKEQLNEQYHEDPIGTQEKIDQYKQEDIQAQTALLENQKAEKRLYNEDMMVNIDQQSEIKFVDLIPEMKQVLKSTKIFKDEQIEAFAKDPYLEDFNVLLDLRTKALHLKRSSQKKEDTPPADPTPPKKEDELNKKAEEKRKEDLVNKINKVQTRKTNPIRGTGGKAGDVDLVSNLKQTNSGKYDLSSLSKEELAKLKKQAESLD